MIRQIDLHEVSRNDRFAPHEDYALLKAMSAVNERPDVYRVEGHILFVDMDRAPLTLEQICLKLCWGIQWNSREI